MPSRLRSGTPAHFDMKHELSALLWVPEIQDLAQYQKDLKTAVANVLAMVLPKRSHF
ncbi:hypothetical protein B0H11DRAFT_2224564 [Mycena galericulata]|nr:hypothetical protein B0H11DRAFT_2224564 [Mycena galericulata]